MDSKKKNRKTFYILAYLILIVASFVPFFYMQLFFARFDGDYLTEMNKWATNAQYISGSVGTLLSALTIILVVHSIYLQRKEFENMIENQNDMMRLLNYQIQESFFFNLIDLHHRITDSTFIIIDDGNSMKGRESFKRIIRECFVIWHEKAHLNIPDRKNEVIKFINTKKEGFSHYLNNMQQTFSFLEKIIDVELKKKYLSVYISQLSNSELALILYLSLKTNLELKKIANKYCLVDYIDKEENLLLPENQLPLVIKELLIDAEQ